ncbi:flagellar export chaperone FliS [Noviherbaspirillum sp.]|uniref:flagellar export chaperone FliS n=1 Tax=Noviherbaspirillum sp. TaxID=1926288 RepID=UPI002D3768C2|nr:flagellar export chaperone FliS [Noviherbaspirillum sp.]HZW20785.1 flagellar export chaperone FliS [Noviherbaspirillum sp.]
MFGSTRTGANAYATVGIETGVAAASPHKLVVMLFEGAMIAISSAIQHLQSGNTAAKGQAISKAITIIENGLRASLDKKVGGDIALNLDALYEYMCSRLIIANAKNQVAVLEEVYQLLKGLKDAWESIPAAANPQPSPAAPKPVAYDPLAPQQPSRLMKA